MGGADDLERAEVVARHDGDGLRHRLEPGGERGRLALVPKRREAARIVDVEDVAALSGERERLEKTVATLARPAVVAKAAEREIPVAALEEMFGSAVAERDVVRPDLRHARERRDIVQIDQRQP
ncbi:MAG: hypothetical protein QM736_06130 [Vicinamibacterales bacterium]